MLERKAIKYTQPTNILFLLCQAVTVYSNKIIIRFPQFIFLITVLSRDRSKVPGRLCSNFPSIKRAQ